MVKEVFVENGSITVNGDGEPGMVLLEVMTDEYKIAGLTLEQAKELSAALTEVVSSLEQSNALKALDMLSASINGDRSNLIGEIPVSEVKERRINHPSHHATGIPADAYLQQVKEKLNSVTLDVSKIVADTKESKLISMTGIPCIDAICGGVRSGELMVFTGTPGCGKTSIILSIAHHCAVENGKGVYIHVSELTKAEVEEKLLAMHMQWLVSLGASWETINAQKGRLKEILFPSGKHGRIIIDTDPINPMRFFDMMRTLKETYSDIECVIVDDVNLVGEYVKSERGAVGGWMDIAGKRVATELGVGVIFTQGLTVSGLAAVENNETLKLEHLAGLSEGRRYINQCISIIPHESEKGFIKMSTLKSRCTEGFNNVLMAVDFRRGTIEPITTVDE